MSSPSLDDRINDHRSLLDLDLIDKDDLKKYELDTLIQTAGGFGRLQWFLMIYVIIASQGFTYFMFNFAYLELVPKILWKYNPSDEFIQCEDYKDIWIDGKVHQWKVDYEDKYSFHNWITEQNMYCKGDFLIGLFGCWFFVGFGLMGIVIKLGDIYGRK